MKYSNGTRDAKLATTMALLLFFLAAIGFFVGLALKPAPGMLRSAYILFVWLLWLGFKITFPIAACKTGVVPVPNSSPAIRSETPFAFWVVLGFWWLIAFLILLAGALGVLMEFTKFSA